MMHILLAVLGLITAVWIWLWRLEAAAKGAKLGLDGIRELRMGVRRFGWKNKLNADFLGQLDDPRIAAACMMVALAQTHSAITGKEEDCIRTQMRQNFRTPDGELDEIYAQARWLVKDSLDLPNTHARVRNLLMTRLQPAERRDLITMLQAVADAGNPNDHAFLQADINKVRTNMGL